MVLYRAATSRLAALASTAAIIQSGCQSNSSSLSKQLPEISEPKALILVVLWGVEFKGLILVFLLVCGPSF